MRAFLLDLWSHRGFRYTFLTVAGIGSFWFILHLALNWSGEKRWQRIKTQLEAEGETFDFYALYPPPIPDDQNFCAIDPLNGIRTPEGTSPEAVAAKKKREVIKDAASILDPKLNLGSISDGLTMAQLPEYGAMLEGLARGSSLSLVTPRPNWKDVRVALEAKAPILQKLAREVHARNKADYLPRPARKDLPELIVRLPMPQLDSGHELGRLFQFHSLVCLQSGDAQAAVNSALVLLRLSDAADASRTLLSNLMAVTQRTQFYSLLWLMLQSRCLEEKDLVLIQAELGHSHGAAKFLESFRSEMVMGVSSLDYLEKHPQDRWATMMTTGSPSTSSVGANLSSMIPPGYFAHSKAAIVELESDWILRPLKTQGLRNAATQYAALIAHLGSLSLLREPDKILAKWTVPSFGAICSMAAYAENHRLQAIMACALERHFRIHGQYPSDLDSLDPKTRLGSDTLDVNHEKMHYSLVPVGRFRLWSPGPDCKDDGGKFGVEIKTRAYRPRSAYGHNYLGDWVWRYDPAVKVP